MLRLLIYTNTVDASDLNNQGANSICQLGGVGDSMTAVKLQPTDGACKTLTVAGVNQQISYTLDSYADGHVQGLSFHTSLPCTTDPTTGKPTLLFCEVCNATVKTELCTVPLKAKLNATSFGSFAVMPDSVAKMVDGKLEGPLQAGHVPAAAVSTVTEVLWPSSLTCADETQAAVQVVSYQLAPACTKDPASSEGSDTYYTLTNTANEIGGKFGCANAACADALCTIVIAPSAATNPTCAAKHVVIKPLKIDLNLSAILLPTTALNLLPPPPTTTTTTRTTTTKHNTTTLAPTYPPTPNPNHHLDSVDKALIGLMCILVFVAVAAVYVLLKRLARSKRRHDQAAAAGGHGGGGGGELLHPTASDTATAVALSHCPKCDAVLPHSSINFCTVCGHSLPADLKPAGLSSIDVSGDGEASEDDRLYRERQLQQAAGGGGGIWDGGPDFDGVALQAKQYGKRVANLASAAASTTGGAAKAASGRVWGWLCTLGRYFVGASKHGFVVVTRALETPKQPVFVRKTVGWISLLTSTMFALHSILWAELKPFDAFSKNVFEQVGSVTPPPFQCAQGRCSATPISVLRV